MPLGTGGRGALAWVDLGPQDGSQRERVPANVLAVSGGWSPTVHLFIKMSAYRGSANSFAVVGLEAKNPAELYNDPPYECVWIPGPDSLTWAPGSTS